MLVIGIVGWKNSGKTRLMQKMIKYFSKKNFIVATIKHAHHNFEIDKPGTDSFLHRKSGSQQVIVSSSKRWVKINELEDEPEKKLDDLLKELDSVDIVIIEGFKNSPYPKIEIIKENSDNYLFSKLKNIIGIVCDEKINTILPQFKRTEIDKIAKLIISYDGNILSEHDLLAYENIKKKNIISRILSSINYLIWGDV